MDEECSEPTKEIAKDIRRINVSTVHKICSGQVVLNLATAVKELVENALDAGATIIEVKLREQGIESIEVSDNGEGVMEKNFEGLTAKYHTSKLREFADLECVETFGFRGEALSSLCALSTMIITTRHRSSDYGTRLELDDRGTITKKSICARQIGTTVQLTNLFASLPVRKREFARNIKREFAKMCQILQGYCLVASGVRIICTNQNQKSAKSVIMATNGVDSVLDNITAIFGPKQRSELLQIKSATEESEKLSKSILEELDTNLSIDVNEELQEADLGRFTINGWISSCCHGSGRSSKDRQFIYINSRPCEPKKILKIINEYYHRYNGSQSPFVYLNIIVQRSDVDVNLTPDKRQLLVNNEKLLLLVLKKCLLNTFGDVPSTFKMQNLNLTSTKKENNDEIDTAPNSKKFSQMLTQWKTTGHTDKPCTSEKVVKRKVTTEVETRTLKMRKIQEYLKRNEDETTVLSDDDTLSTTKYQSDCENTHQDDLNSTSIYLTPPESVATFHQMLEHKIEPFKIIDTYNGESVASSSQKRNIKLENNIQCVTPIQDENNIRCVTPIQDENNIRCVTPIQDEYIGKIVCRNRSPPSSEKKLKIEKEPSRNSIKSTGTPRKAPLQISIIKATPSKSSDACDDLDVQSTNSSFENGSYNDSEPLFDIDIDDDRLATDVEQIGFKSQCTLDMSDKISTSIQEIQQLLNEEEKLRDNIKQQNLERLKFKATIDPSKNKIAEEELKTEISKESFAQMEIIGQFNLGFIIVKLDDDLFIVDQHATDEKFNFETLQKETTLYNQQLVVPQQLELTAVSEMILIDNIKVFEMNGFRFKIDNDAQPTRKVKLIAKPMSKNWEFGKDEIDELLFMLQESPNTLCRPSKISAMFASRACRKSVMIGTALSRSDMQKLITQMGEIEQPWNCPHGRPTMRHLINMAMLDISQD